MTIDNDYYDISPVLNSKTAVFPGDQPFERRVAMAFSKGHHLDLSAVLTTLHIGAHADAPSHYHADGQTIEKRSLTRYIGAAQVIRLPGVGARRLLASDLKNKKITAPRVLFYTGTFKDPNHWTNEFASLSPDLIETLYAQGVQLVGIDTPSVDPADSKALESHQALYKRDFAVLEGICLEDVPEGDYFLSALPLRMAEADASPVRAALWKNWPQK